MTTATPTSHRFQLLADARAFAAERMDLGESATLHEILNSCYCVRLFWEVRVGGVTTEADLRRERLGPATPVATPEGAWSYCYADDETPDLFATLAAAAQWFDRGEGIASPL